jgi:hypothetical protein
LAGKSGCKRMEEEKIHEKMIWMKIPYWEDE